LALSSVAFITVNPDLEREVSEKTSKGVSGWQRRRPGDY